MRLFLLITLLAYSMLGSNMSKWNLHSNDYWDIGHLVSTEVVDKQTAVKAEQKKTSTFYLFSSILGMF